MRDIPVFTTENGAASLVLHDVQGRGDAYVRIQASLDPAALAEECASFCAVCGAKAVYAAGAEELENLFPLHAVVYSMRGLRETLPQTDAALWPVLPENAMRWREIYNTAMAGIDCASYLTASEAEKLAESAGAYFVHRGEQLLGIGKISDNCLEAVVSMQYGAGWEVVSALCSTVDSEDIRLEVASTNEKAIRLYRRLGFCLTGEIARWYKIR